MSVAAEHDTAHAAAVAHHFHTAEQQHSSAKLGMWLFLVQELLFFAGVFLAYAAFRYLHPATLLSAHEHLNVPLGTLNTVFLITSSLTMALAVHAAQLSDGARLRRNLLLTITFACCFLGVKYIEYAHKFHDGLLAGKYFTAEGLLSEPQREQLQHVFRLKDHPERVYFSFKPGYTVSERDVARAFAEHHMPTRQVDRAPSTLAVNPATLTLAESFHGASDDPGTWGPSATANTMAVSFAGKPHVFFGIYFAMTGLHGLHVLVGIFLIAWIWSRARRAEFSSAYYTPVENVGLYWHLVDLIWIFLFPLLYLVR